MTPGAHAGIAIEPARAALAIIDIQERLAAAMTPEILDQVESNVSILCELARRFAMPVVLTEQYPRGLGRTRAPIEAAVASLGGLLHRFDKLEFSAARAEAFGPLWERLRRTQWIVTGMECHVCVYQTARQLCELGASVQVPCDAVVSRRTANWEVGLELISRAGAIVTSTETIVFDALQTAGSDDFRAMSRLVR
jgi:nicotinamidase-related amidase